MWHELSPQRDCLSRGGVLAGSRSPQSTETCTVGKEFLASVWDAKAILVRVLRLSLKRRVTCNWKSPKHFKRWKNLSKLKDHLDYVIQSWGGVGNTKDVKMETVGMQWLVGNGRKGEKWVDEEMCMLASMPSTWVRNVGESKHTQGGDCTRRCSVYVLQMLSLIAFGSSDRSCLGRQ